MDNLSLNDKKPEVAGGGGGPKFSFSSALGASSFDPSAFEFVPSWTPQPQAMEIDHDPLSQQAAYTDHDESEHSQMHTQKQQKPTKTPPKPKETPQKQHKPKPEASAVQEQVVVADISALGKEHLNMIFMGHVDAGKSTMGGHLLFLTGMVDKRTMEKYEREAKELGRESWYLSWALDLNQEERNKVPKVRLIV